MRPKSQHILWIIPVALLIAFVIIDIDPSGERSFTWKPEGGSRVMDDWLPRERTNVERDVLRVIDEPVYAALHVPRREYVSLTLDMNFDPEEQDVVEVGVLTDIFSQSYRLVPVYHRLIEGLDWQVDYYDELALYTRPGAKVYSSLEEFYASEMSHARIATYHADLLKVYKEEDYRPLGGTRTIDSNLRGFHQFVTYIEGEKIELTLTYQDLDEVPGEDEIVIVIRNAANEIVAREAYEDTEESIGMLEYRIADLPEGVYTIQLSTTSDIVFTSMETNLRYMSFIDRLQIVSTDEVELQTNADELIFETITNEGLQTITSNDDEITIASIDEHYNLDLNPMTIETIDIPSGSITLAGKGKYAFSEDAFFDPHPRALTSDALFEEGGIDYLLTSYESPVVVEDGLRKARSVISLAGAYLDASDSYKLLLSLPSIDEGIELGEIDVIFQKPRLKFFEFFRELVAYLPGI